jgi:hypothetical protein
MGPHTLVALEGELRALASAGGALVVATDNDRAGDRYHAQLAEMAQAAGVRSERLLPPPDQDWNDSLKQGRGGMKPDRAWVLLGSGRRLDLIDPKPDAFTDADLATGLSRTYRWGGHSNWDLPLSVAQHSLLVLVLRQRMQPHQPLTPGEALRELLHDADEGLLGFDPISPLKAHLGAAFDALSRRLRQAIAIRYGLPDWAGDDHLLHKRADHLAAASEALHVAGWSRDAIRETLGIRLAPVLADPLPRLDGLQQPWPPRRAAAVFLAKLRELNGANQPMRPRT